MLPVSLTNLWIRQQRETDSNVGRALAAVPMRLDQKVRSKKRKVSQIKTQWNSPKINNPSQFQSARTTRKKLNIGSRKSNIFNEFPTRTRTKTVVAFYTLCSTNFSFCNKYIFIQFCQPSYNLTWWIYSSLNVLTNVEVNHNLVGFICASSL